MRRVYYAGHTKADTLSDKELEGYSKTPFGRKCAGCGITLVTEEDFARHFVISDDDWLYRLYNLGECPNKVIKNAGTLVHTIRGD